MTAVFMWLFHVVTICGTLPVPSPAGNGVASYSLRGLRARWVTGRLEIFAGRGVIRRKGEQN